MRKGANTFMKDLRRRLHREIQQLLRNARIHHVILRIESLDGTFRWTAAEGYAHPYGTALHPHTPFWLASVTKLYIATSVMRLVERGMIDLDRPMSAYLPDSMIKGMHQLDGIDYTSMVTVRHLITHSSGLPDYLEGKPDRKTMMFDQVIEENRYWTPSEAFNVVREHMRPHFPPQNLNLPKYKVRYSDTNFQLLIEILQTVTGERVADVLRKLIFEPLELEQTWLPGTREDPLPVPASIWADDTPVAAQNVLVACRDLYSDLDNTVRFMRALIGGELFEDPNTWARMSHQRQRFGISFSPRPIAPGWPIEYGMGVMAFKIPRVMSPFAPVPELIGHTGVSGSWLFYVPELEMIFSGTVNQVAAPEVPYRFVPRLAAIIAKHR
jgi:D-alanyl-D-alanine carboxypeptidase